MLNSMGSSNLLESIISIVKTSKSPLVVVQERLKLSGVMSETVSSPTSGCTPEEGNNIGQKGTAQCLLLEMLCFALHMLTALHAALREKGLNRSLLQANRF